jgi:hypothetical protein
MTFDRRALGGALAALVLVAACGGSSSPAASSAQGSSAAPAATATPAAASQEPTETAAPTEGAGPSLIPGAASELEAMLPAEANGVKFQKGSFDGGSVPGGIPIGGSEDDFAKFLADNGKSLSDVKIAIASPVDSSAAGGTLVMAIQVEGVASDKLLAWATKDATDMAKSTIGGKEVYGAGAAGFGAYFYVKDDVVFYVLSMGGDAATTEEIFTQRP